MRFGIQTIEKLIHFFNFEQTLPIEIVIIFLLLLIFLILNSKTIMKNFYNIKKKTWVLLIIIFLFGFIMRFFFISEVSINNDSLEYLHVANNMLHTGKYANCIAYVDNCLSTWLMIRPPGSTLIHAIGFLIFDNIPGTGFYISAFFGSLSIILIFFLTYLLFKNEKAALWSSVILSTLFHNIVWSKSGYPSSINLFFTLLTLICFLLYFNKQLYKLLILALLSLAYTIQIRPEGILLIPLILVMFLLFDKNLKYKIKDYKFLSIIILFFIALSIFFAYFIVMYQAHVEWTDTYGPQSEDYDFFFIGTFKSNLTPVLKYWFDYNAGINILFLKNNNVLVILFLLISVSFIFKYSKKILVFLLLWFSTFLIFFSFYMYLYERYFMTSYAPFIIIQSYGLYSIIKKFKFKLIRVLLTLSITYFLLFPINDLSLFESLNQKSISEERSMVTKNYRFMQETKGKINDSCIIISSFPGITMTVMHKKSILSKYFMDLNDKQVEMLFSRTGNCVLFRSSWYPDSDKQILEFMLDKYYLEAIYQMKDSDLMEGEKIIFYKLKRI